MKPVVIVFLFIILIISCQNNNIEENNQIKTFNIKKLPKVTNVKLSDLGFIDIEYIPLETSKKSLIQRTINIGSYGDRIIVGNNSIIIK
ncbi:6-bladed beta-propeller, partial [Pseudobacteroides sp.]|uniref:6-bladed beta-propeller n=1 Tax=Pseudobacteroides sp. TaxID=1968840 RepID=UPI002F951B64